MWRILRAILWEIITQLRVNVSYAGMLEGGLMSVMAQTWALGRGRDIPDS